MPFIRAEGVADAYAARTSRVSLREGGGSPVNSRKDYATGTTPLEVARMAFPKGKAHSASPVIHRSAPANYNERV